MDRFKRLLEYLAFTKNEQKVFLFLSVVLLSGIAVKAYKAYIVPQTPAEYDYTGSDSVFTARTQISAADSSGSSKETIKKIDLNTATKSELMTLPGVGESTADRILLHREERGSFKNIDELKKVKGIGEKKFEKLKLHIEVK